MERSNELMLWIVLGVCALITFSVLSPVIGIIASYLGVAITTVSAPNAVHNYQWFKDQESAMAQIQNQICFQDSQIADFKQTYGSNSSTWSGNEQNNYADLQFVKSGYVSKYNALVGDYNAKRSSLISGFGRDPNLPPEHAEFFDANCGLRQIQ